MTRIHTAISLIVLASSCATYLRFRGERLLDRIILFQQRVRSGYYCKINPNAKCPSCGSRDGEIFYSSELQRIVHTCHVDNAMWCDMPRIPAKVWDFAGRDLKAAGDHKEDIREMLARANRPIVPKSEEKKVESVQ